MTRSKTGWPLSVVKLNCQIIGYFVFLRCGKVTINGKPSDDVTGNLLKSIEKQAGIVF